MNTPKLFILLLIFFINCKPKQDNLKKINELYLFVKKSNVERLTNYRLFYRNNDFIGIIYYYEHNDSSEFLFKKDGSIIEISKFNQIGFGLNKNVDSMYLPDKGSYIPYHVGLEAVSNKISSNKDSLDRTVKKLIHFFKETNVKEIVGLPWNNTIIFIINDQARLLKINNEHLLKKAIDEGFIKIDSNYCYFLSDSIS